MARLLIIAAALGGCATNAPGSSAAPDPGVLSATLAASQPEPLVDLVLEPRETLGVEEDCPRVEIVDESRERWLGGCALSDGTVVSGELSRYSGPEGAWIAADGFSMRLDGELILYLDGAVELLEDGDQMTLDAASSLCGVGLSCAEGIATVDLSFSLFPIATWPVDYDATVTGVVALGGTAPTAVDATWSVDEAVCPSEPVDGLFTMARGERQALSLDGEDDCDGCATWNVQGLAVGEYCGINL